MKPSRDVLVLIIWNRSLCSRWNPNKFGWNQSLAASMKLNPSLSLRSKISSRSDFICKADFFRRKTDLVKKAPIFYQDWCFFLVTRTGIEPMLQPWKGRVLTAWPTGQKMAKVRFELTTCRVWTGCSSHWAISPCLSLNAQLLYHDKTHLSTFFWKNF